MRSKSLIISLLLITSMVSFSQTKHEVKRFQLSDRMHKIEIGSVNMLVFVEDDYLILSDCGYKDTGTQIDSVLNEISPNPVKYIINTHWHNDHTGGNLYFLDATVIAHEDTKKLLSQDIVSEFWKSECPAFPEYALPNITFSSKLTYRFDNEEIEMVYYPGGHTQGDIVVYFKNSNIVHLGDLLFSNGFPAIDFEQGATVKQFIANLQKIIEWMPENAIIIAGHGPDMNLEQLKDYKNTISETYSIVKKQIDSNLTLEQIQKKDVLAQYYEWEHGYFTRQEWVEIIYKSLKYKTK